MKHMMDAPVIIFVVSLLGLWLSAQVGAFFRIRLRPVAEDQRQDLNLVIGAALTLLGLLIGFSFSMAISRYDQRKNYEEEEANAIGTEYLRADLLPGEQATKVRELLVRYVDQRVRFYEVRDNTDLIRINRDTAQLQKELWSEIRATATSQPTPVVALVVGGMNDVLNTQGYTQAAWWNRIPVAAWILMVAIAVCCNILIGYVAHRSATLVFIVLPLAVSIAFLLIADIDSPRGGVIHVRPQNLVSLSRSLAKN
jgi:hypothetical protein